jgi:hypothetical protein
MLVECSKSVVLSVAEIALVAGAVPSRMCCDVLYVGVRVGKQLICQQTFGVALTDSSKDCMVIDVWGPWT